jgi:hypothetical protein
MIGLKRMNFERSIRAATMKERKIIQIRFLMVAVRCSVLFRFLTVAVRMLGFRSLMVTVRIF